MNKLLYSIIAILLAGCIWLYIEQYQTIRLLQDFDRETAKAKVKCLDQRDTILNLKKRVDSLQDNIYSLTMQHEELKRNPVVITKTITNKNEKVSPISHTTSEYYNSILSKRYQDK